jgi:ribonuclease HII
MQKILEKKLLLPYYSVGLVEAGCDEAGRGCLAGPVFAAAVVLPADFSHPLLTDSKQLTALQRNALRIEVEQSALMWAVQSVDNVTIDEINILNASILAMHRALESLPKEPQHIIVDGNRFKKFRDIPYECIIKGDSKYYAIAAASILAKTWRDEYMEKLHAEYPQYGWDVNKAYPTKAHRAAIAKYGTTPYHRKSFKLLETQLSFDF